jgi:hypothetical protein
MYQPQHVMPLFVEFLLLGLFGLALFGLFRFLISRVPENRYYKYGIAVGMVTGFLLFWVNGAVGIIGSENNDANMMYLLVLLLAFLASIAFGFRPERMMWVMRGSAVAFVLIAVLALVFDVGVSGPVWPWDVVWITGFFMALLLFAAWLFEQAAAVETRKDEG